MKLRLAMKVRLLGFTAVALFVIPAVTVLGTQEAFAQRGLYKGWLAPAKYRINEERRFTIGGGLPTGSFKKARRDRNW